MHRPSPGHPFHQPLDLPVVTSLDGVVALLRPSTAVFLRYSGGPLADAAVAARDTESGCVLPGLPVAPLVPETWWLRPSREWIARQLCQFSELWGGRLTGWILTGRTCGRGPDGEPLVTDVRPLALLGDECLDEASHLYATAFAGNPARW